MWSHICSVVLLLHSQDQVIGGHPLAVKDDGVAQNLVVEGITVRGGGGGEGERKSSHSQNIQLQKQMLKWLSIQTTSIFLHQDYCS